MRPIVDPPEPASVVGRIADARRDSATQPTRHRVAGYLPRADRRRCHPRQSRRRPSSRSAGPKAVELMPHFGAALDHRNRQRRPPRRARQERRRARRRRRSSGWPTATSSSPRSLHAAPQPSSGARCAPRSVGRRPTTASPGSSGSGATLDCARGSIAETGMWCLHGEFDPETGAILDKRLQQHGRGLFHDARPTPVPTDPLEKQHHLRALALMLLIDGGSASGRARSIDMSVLVDAKTLDRRRCTTTR